MISPLELAEPSRVALEPNTQNEMFGATILTDSFFEKLQAITDQSGNPELQGHIADYSPEVESYVLSKEGAVDVAMVPIKMPLDINGAIRIQGDEAAEGMQDMPGRLFVLHDPDSELFSYIIARPRGESMHFGRFPDLGEVDSLSAVVTPTSVHIFAFNNGERVEDFEYTENDAAMVLYAINGALTSKIKRLDGPHAVADRLAFQASRS